MKVYRSYKVELKPNNKQETYFKKSVGIARLAFNWGLNLSIEQHKLSNKFLGAIGLHKEINKLKKDKFNFMYDVSKQIPQNALRDLDSAFKNFFKSIKQNKKVGFPKFKSKKNNKQSFRIDGSTFKISQTHIKLPIIGLVRFKEHNYIPLKENIIKYISATVSKNINKWFVSVIVEVEQQEDLRQTQEVLGVDLGIKELATCSNKEVFSNPRNTYKYAKKLKREQQRLSKKKKGSSNRDKQRQIVAKVHRRMSNSRIDTIHKMTTKLTKTNVRVIVIEDLNVKGMVKNRKLSKALSDSSFGEIRRQLEYKTKFYGGSVYVVNRFYPSSKTCSECSNIKIDLKLSDRVYQCSNEKCKLHLEPIDRDLNASINLRNYYVSTASSVEI